MMSGNFDRVGLDNEYEELRQLYREIFADIRRKYNGDIGRALFPQEGETTDVVSRAFIQHLIDLAQ